MLQPADLAGKAVALVELGRYFFQRGWVPATSSNFSARLEDGSIAVTRSGAHKGEMDPGDIMRVDAAGHPLAGQRRPSAELGLHLGLYRWRDDIGAVLHTHSVNATVLSQMLDSDLVFRDYELQKAFDGVTTHQGELVVPVFDNDQNIDRLAARVDDYLGRHADTPGYLISGHGLYTWGRSIGDARRHVEAFEFLMECELLKRRLPS